MAKFWNWLLIAVQEYGLPKTAVKAEKKEAKNGKDNTGRTASHSWLTRAVGLNHVSLAGSLHFQGF